MFSSPRTKYEGIWKITDVEPMGEDEILVKFKTAFFVSEDKAKDPKRLTPCAKGPLGEQIQTVILDRSNLPTVSDFNSGERNKLYTVLTEKLEFETKE